jgi:hypothetical protein
MNSRHGVRQPWWRELTCRRNCEDVDEVGEFGFRAVRRRKRVWHRERGALIRPRACDPSIVGESHRPKRRRKAGLLLPAERSEGNRTWANGSGGILSRP